ncbi:MAG: cupin domain-containing protein [Acidimicrobiia bacterium]
MATARPHAVSIDDAIATLTFLSNRSPMTTAEESSSAFARVSDYREGGVFVGHWAGNSEWERHPVGDEIVMVVAGETTIFFLAEDGEHSKALRLGDLIVVPQNTWHRFETPVEVKLLSVTPQPTDHQSDQPT